MTNWIGVLCRSSYAVAASILLGGNPAEPMVAGIPSHIRTSILNWNPTSVHFKKNIWYHLENSFSITVHAF